MVYRVAWPRRPPRRSWHNRSAATPLGRARRGRPTLAAVDQGTSGPPGRQATWAFHPARGIPLDRKEVAEADAEATTPSAENDAVFSFDSLYINKCKNLLVRKAVNKILRLRIFSTLSYLNLHELSVQYIIFWLVFSSPYLFLNLSLSLKYSIEGFPPPNLFTTSPFPQP